jgi:hypothetical protein
MKFKGKPVPRQERAKWPMSKLVKETKKLIRSDFGGKNAIDVILNKAKARGLNFSTEEAEFVKNLIVEQVAGSRKRVEHNLSMLEERIIGLT